MKSITTILFLFLTISNSFGQTLDEILTKHFEAVGMEALKDVETIQYKGNYYNRFLEKMGNGLPEKLLKPDFILTVEKNKGYRLQTFSDPGNFITCFYNGDYWINQNGNVDENWNPGKPDQRIIHQEIELDGFLYHWKEKGYTLTRLENAKLNDKEHYKLKLENSKIGAAFFYIDINSNLLSHISYGGDLTDGKECPNIEFRKYKKVKNIVVSFQRIHTELMLDGSYGKKEVIINEVLINPKLDKEIFKSSYKN